MPGFNELHQVGTFSFNLKMETARLWNVLHLFMAMHSVQKILKHWRWIYLHCKSTTGSVHQLATLWEWKYSCEYVMLANLLTLCCVTCPSTWTMAVCMSSLNCFHSTHSSSLVLDTQRNISVLNWYHSVPKQKMLTKLHFNVLSTSGIFKSFVNLLLLQS